MGEDGGEIARARKESGEKETERRARALEGRKGTFLPSSPLVFAPPQPPPSKPPLRRNALITPRSQKSEEGKRKKGRMARSVDSSVAAVAAPFLFFCFKKMIGPFFCLVFFSCLFPPYLFSRKAASCSRGGGDARTHCLSRCVFFVFAFANQNKT